MVTSARSLCSSAAPPWRGRRAFGSDRGGLVTAVAMPGRPGPPLPLKCPLKAFDWILQGELGPPHIILVLFFVLSITFYVVFVG